MNVRLWVSFAIAAIGGNAGAAADCVVLLTVQDGRAIRTARYVSLAEAVGVAESERRSHASARLRFELAGTCRIESPVILRSELSGVAGTPTVIRSHHEGRTVISGSHVLKVKWMPYKDGIYTADLDDAGFDQLWVNGKRQIRARYPNFDPKVIPFGGYAAGALSRERVARWANPVGGEVHAMHFARWGAAYFRIEGKNADGSLVLGKPSGNNRVRAGTRETEPHATQRYVENILEELDAPGEWFFDRAARKLYYMPENGVDLARSNIEATGAEQLIVVAGGQSAPVHDIRIEGLTFTHTARTVMKAYEPMLRSDWAIYRSGAITIEGGDRISIADSDFRDLGGNAVFASGYNRRVSVTGNLFEDIGGTAIHFAGKLDAVRSPVLQYADGLPLEAIDRESGPKSDNYPAQCIARDNLIRRIGLADKQAAGVAIDIAQEITVGHNSIYDVPRAGINIGNGNFGGHVIEHNDVFNTVLETGDHGSFNSWGRDRYWHPDTKEMHRRAASNPNMPFLDAMKPTVLRNNRWRTDDGFDVDLDDGSSNYEIYNNVLLRGGLKAREGFRRIMTNNVIVNNGFHPHASFAKSGDVLKHNILMGPYQPILVDQWDFDFDENLFTTDAALKGAQQLGADKRSVKGDPMFVNAAGGDFRVRLESPALRIGFKNFPMQFGVESPRLRAIAKTPVIPELLNAGPARPGKTYNFSGATIKSIETLGEQSATGAPDRKGALVVAVPPRTKAAEAGIQRGDVIRSVDVYGAVFEVEDAPALLVLQASHKWVGELRIKVLRQQTTVELLVRYE